MKVPECIIYIFIAPNFRSLNHVIYDQACNASCHQELEIFQYNAALALTGTFRYTSREKVYQESDLKSLQ